jgi:hypothetical protein
MFFLTGLCSAISIKMASSIDDVVWLAPFLTVNVSKRVRLQNALVYIAVCLIQTIAAMGIAKSGDAFVAWLTGNSKDAWSTEKILTVFAGGLLAIYTVKLTYEYVYESDDEDEGAEQEPGDQDRQENKDCNVSSELELGGRGTEAAGESDHATLLACDEASAGHGLKSDSPSRREITLSREPEEHTAKADSKGQQTLFVIAFVGSVDDLTLFVPMLVGKGFTWLQLMSGALIAASTIVLICLFIGLCKPVANFLSSIPLALIVAIFSASLLVKGFTME